MKKAADFLFFSRIMRKGISKNISKSLSSKYSQKYLDYAKKSATVAFKTASKIVIQKSQKFQKLHHRLIH